jgi:hypothetical protein
MENVIKEAVGTPTIESAPPLPPVQPETGRGFWGNAGIVILIIAGIAVVTKVLSD